MSDINELVNQLQDSSPDLRSGAVKVLAESGGVGKTGSHRGIRQLEKMATAEPDDSVRQTAKRALRK